MVTKAKAAIYVLIIAILGVVLVRLILPEESGGFASRSSDDGLFAGVFEAVSDLASGVVGSSSDNTYSGVVERMFRAIEEEDVPAYISLFAFEHEDSSNARISVAATERAARDSMTWLGRNESSIVDSVAFEIIETHEYPEDELQKVADTFFHSYIPERIVRHALLITHIDGETGRQQELRRSLHVYMIDGTWYADLISTINMFRFVNRYRSNINPITQTHGNFEFVVEDGVIVIVGYTGNTPHVTVPANINGYRVDAVGIRAFMGSNTLVSITLPEGLTRIDGQAFQRGGELETVSLPSTLRYIGTNAFNSTRYLANITLPNSLEEIGQYAFAYNSSLTNITIPDSVTHLGAGAFWSAGLESLTIGGGVARMGSFAFSRNRSLSNLVIHEGIRVIGEGAFSDNGSLVNVTIPSSVTFIGGGAFQNNTSLVNVVIPYGIEYILTNTFTGNTSLVNVTIPDSVHSILAHAFARCPSLSDDTIHRIASLSRTNMPFGNQPTQNQLDILRQHGWR